MNTVWRLLNVFLHIIHGKVVVLISAHTFSPVCIFAIFDFVSKMNLFAVWK